MPLNWYLSIDEAEARVALRQTHPASKERFRIAIRGSGRNRLVNFETSLGNYAISQVQKAVLVCLSALDGVRSILESWSDLASCEER